MGNLISVVYLLFFLAAGLVLARRTVPDESGEVIVCLGCAYAVAMLAMLPMLVGLVMGFNLAGLLVCLLLAIGAGLWAIGVPQCLRAQPGTPLRDVLRGMPNATTQASKSTKSRVIACAACVLPLCALTVYLLHTHVLYEQSGAYYTGQSGYGDIAMHLAFIKSIANWGEMLPHYPLIAGQTLFGYPFLAETVSSVFVVLGASLKFAYILPCIPALVSVFGFGWIVARTILDHVGKACLAFVLFFMGSGFGFAYFFESKEMFGSIFTGYYTTPTNYITENIRWVNAIADLLVPQRATLMGWALLFPCLYLLYRFAVQKQTRLWCALGLLAGCLPLMQTHSLLALVLLSAVYAIYALVDALRARDMRALYPWVGYVVVAGVLCIPQLVAVIFAQTSSGHNFLNFHFNWSNEGDNYFWFYIKNIGVVYLLLLPAFLWASKKLRLWYGASLLILLLSEVILFQPNPYDNIKLLFIWFLYSCILVASALWDWCALIPKRSVRVVLAVMVICCATVGSVLTLGREAVSSYQTFSQSAVRAGEWVEEQTPYDALFLTGRQHLNPVVSLAGRDIMCGSNLYVYFHGMEFSAQENAIKELYETPSEELLATWGIDYVYLSSYERYDYAVDEAWYAARYTCIYQEGDVTIYQICA